MVSKKSNIYFASLVFVFCIVSIFLHLYDLEKMPSGMHVDEASIAYNAHCISKIGTDEHGIPHPVFFKCFSDYKDPILIYTIVPFTKFFDLTKTLIRAPSAIYHIFASIVFFFLARKFIENRWVCLCSAFVFSLLPWVFPVSRTCIGGYTPLLFGTLCGIYFLIDFVSTESKRTAIFAALSWAFAFYSHHPGRPMVVIIIACFVISFYVVVVKRIRLFVFFLLIFCLLIIPMLISVFQTPHALTMRFNAISVWRDNPGIFEVILRIAHRYIGYFGHQFLFISGDSNYAHSTQYTGALFTFMAPFVIAGGYIVIKRILTDNLSRFLVFMILSYPTAAMLTIGHRHGTACIGGSIYWVLLSGIGFNYIFYKIKTLDRKILFSAVVILVGLGEMIFYFKDYFSVYRESSRWIFSANIYETLEKAVKLRREEETIYISKYVFFPVNPNHDFKPEFYTIILFLTKLDPEIYIKEGIPDSLVSLYNYAQHKKGLLIRLDSLVVGDASGKIKQIDDYEPMPDTATLLGKTITPSGISIMIYRIEQ